MNRPQLFARLILAGIGLLVLTLALSFSGCRSARPAPPKVETPAQKVDSSGQKVETPAPPFFLSTPEGSARRQAVRLAKASVPRKLGKGAVYAPKATEVVNAYKNKAAVINADSGAIVTAIGKNKASAATAPNATATTSTSKGVSYWWLLLLAIPAGWWVYKKIVIPYA